MKKHLLTIVVLMTACLCSLFAAPTDAKKNVAVLATDVEMVQRTD